MIKKEDIRVFVDTILDMENKKQQLTQENGILKNGFDVCLGDMRIKNGIILLLDKGGCVLGAEHEEIIGYYVRGEYLANPGFGQVTVKVFKISENRNITRWIYDFVLNSYNTEYKLCFFISESEKYSNSQAKDLLASYSIQLNKTVEIINKYLSETSFILKSLDSIDAGITICDNEGHLLYYNESALNIMGNKVEEIRNQKIIDHCDIKPLLYQVMQNKRIISDAEYHFQFNNKVIHLTNSAYPIYGNNKEILGAIDIFRRFENSGNTIAEYNASYRFEDIIGKSEEISEKIELAKTFSNNVENVLIQGESGTGKELFAQSIHNHSNRRKKHFIAINCANFPKELIESELFGYEGGAFTGASAGGKPGKFELADGGTLFLDEIGEMEYHLQAKLLRAIETKTITRISGKKPIKCDVRIISATNRNLLDMVNKGKYRQDLFYRLNVLTVDLPPLRQRGEDILELTHYFLDKIGKKYQKSIIAIKDDAKDMLLSYSWPGNIRELENLILRAILICDSDYIGREHLFKVGLVETIVDESNQIPDKIELKKINKSIILDTLILTDGNKKRAAEILGVSRQTIYRILNTG